MKTSKGKILFAAWIFCILTLASARSGWCVEESNISYTWYDKLLRGVLNVVTSPAELAHKVVTTTNENNLVEGWTLGLGLGLLHTALRMGAGVIDAFTFPFDFPDSEKGPLVRPEYVWEKRGVRFL